MKKTLTIILACIMVFTFSACSIKKIQRDDQGNVIDDPIKTKPYAEMTFDEKIVYMSSRERTAASSVDCGMIAPACALGTNNYGYINSLGQWIISAEYSYAYSFNEGYAPVLDNYNDYEFVNSTGEVLKLNVSKKITMKASRHFYENYVAAVFDTGYEQTKMYYCIDGSTQIKATKLPTVNGVKYASKEYFAVATPFLNGLAVTMRRTNESIIEQYTLAKTQTKKYFESAHIINTVGEVVASLPAGLDAYDYSMNSNGTITVKDMTSENPLFGVCNMKGELIIPCEYYMIEYCENGLFMVADNSGFFGYINEKGEKVIEAQYASAYPFSEGYAAVCDGELWGIINEKGDYIITPYFDYIAGLKNQYIDFNVNVAAVSQGLFVARSGDYWILLNTKCEIIDAVYAPGLETSPYISVGSGMIAFTDYKDGQKKGCGLLNLKGEVILEPDFEYIGVFDK